MRALLSLVVNDTQANQRWRYTARCLPTLGATVDLRQHELVIVDNGSTDPRSIQLVEEYVQDARLRGWLVSLLRLSRNMYVIYAHNTVIFQRLTDHYFCRVENDIEFLTPGWAEKCMRLLRNRSEFALVAPVPEKIMLDPTVVSAAPQTVNVDGDTITIVQPGGHIGGWARFHAPDYLTQIGYLGSVHGKYGEDLMQVRRMRDLNRRMAWLHPYEAEIYHLDREDIQSYRQQKIDWGREEIDAAGRIPSVFPHWPYIEFRHRPEVEEWIYD